METKKKTRRVPFSTSIDAELKTELTDLSEETGIPVSKLTDKAISLVLEFYTTQATITEDGTGESEGDTFISEDGLVAAKSNPIISTLNKISLSDVERSVKVVSELNSIFKAIDKNSFLDIQNSEEEVSSKESHQSNKTTTPKPVSNKDYLESVIKLFGKNTLKQKIKK